MSAEQVAQIDNRRRFAVACVAVACGVAALMPVIGNAARLTDRGRPYRAVPRQFRGEARTVWQAEWISCGGASMRGLARDPDVRLSLRTLRGWLSVSPQYAARRLAYTVETGDAGGGWTGHLLDAAIDGCRNGILWQFYH